MDAIKLRNCETQEVCQILSSKRFRAKVNPHCCFFSSYFDLMQDFKRWSSGSFESEISETCVGLTISNFYEL